MNECTFSECRRWRYSLIHRWDDVFQHEAVLLPWIGLNPSTADENNLDPTLRRIAGFTRKQVGYNGFVMLNLFAWRATDPAAMMRVSDPVGRENDATILRHARAGFPVVCCWGAHGGHLSRWRAVAKMLREHGAKLVCLGTNKDGSPKHPLYLRGDATLQPWEEKP